MMVFKLIVASLFVVFFIPLGIPAKRFFFLSHRSSDVIVAPKTQICKYFTVSTKNRITTKGCGFCNRFQCCLSQGKNLVHL